VNRLSVKRYLSIYAGLFYLFLYLPLAPLAVFSFNTSKVAVWNGFTLQWYRRALADPMLLETVC
jgi:spermidine/putrescine transport system permease protein